MRKIAVFTEGQSELIFVREFLLKLFNYSNLSLECLKLFRDQESYVPYCYRVPNPIVHFTIIQAFNDEGVISSILERANKMVAKGGYERIIGLRDVYSTAYRKLSPNKIDKSAVRQIIKGCESSLQGLPTKDKIRIYFAVMEIEAWFLSMYKIFEKLNPTLTISFIESRLGYDLRRVDPQIAFYRPSQELDRIFKLIRGSYKKKYDEVENICSAMTCDDFLYAFENGKCSFFGKFYRDLSTFTNKKGHSNSL